MKQRTHKPNSGWLAVKVTNSRKEKSYRIFATWCGAFHEPEKWRLSSGSDEIDYSIDECGNYVWPQHTSTYVLEPRLEGALTLFSKSVWRKLEENATNESCIIEIVNINNEAASH
ncbi:hypothetical protein CXF86_11645 [Shewanella sp. GutCb]|uniref:hypothetical protein n=1 Tax=Shewanella sp. GutCb TaxID=2058315 RepID=UPI000C7E0B98|nr:hypothetical protein [Shewanella sp. GutCb]PKG74682.1 hypothetical protein CXF86_11645 [Shewanella sp. GutCb]